VGGIDATHHKGLLGHVAIGGVDEQFDLVSGRQIVFLGQRGAQQHSLAVIGGQPTAAYQLAVGGVGLGIGLDAQDAHAQRFVATEQDAVGEQPRRGHPYRRQRLHLGGDGIWLGHQIPQASWPWSRRIMRPHLRSPVFRRMPSSMSRAFRPRKAAMSKSNARRCPVPAPTGRSGGGYAQAA
jgi:hypothetical protein